jgi:hypothetical protein
MFARSSSIPVRRPARGRGSGHDLMVNSILQRLALRGPLARQQPPPQNDRQRPSHVGSELFLQSDR